MSSITDILAMEKAQVARIILHREGIFYKAYEYSAYLFVHYVRDYKPKRKYVKVAGQEVVSIGFPTSVLDSLPLPPNAKVHKKEDSKERVVIELNEPTETEPELFAKWKNSVTLTTITKSINSKVNTLEATPLVEQGAFNQNERAVLDKLLKFSLESATPIECMLFLTELRKMMTNA
ncbi:MAG: hypothetical protein QM305_06075 [Bacteroidota bacterium]|nr:hypothetical protein [Bacteroidota bacterium]